jgi:hypothetical protein
VIKNRKVEGREGRKSGFARISLFSDDVVWQSRRYLDNGDHLGLRRLVAAFPPADLSAIPWTWLESETTSRFIEGGDKSPQSKENNPTPL